MNKTLMLLSILGAVSLSACSTKPVNEDLSDIDYKASRTCSAGYDVAKMTPEHYEQYQHCVMTLRTPQP